MADGSFSPAAIPPAFPKSDPYDAIDLRPLTTSELIDRGFALYRRHFTGLLLLALLSQAAPLLVQVAITKLHLYPSQSELMAPSLRTLGDSAAVMLLVLLAQVAIFGFEVVMTFYVADAYLGQAPSVTSSFRRFGGRFLASLWTCVLNRILYAVTLVFPLLALVAVEFWYVAHPPASFGALLFFAGATLVLLVASVAPILIVVMRLMVTVPALALEGLSGWAAVRRSSSLVRYDPGLGCLYWGEMRLSFLLLPLFVIELLTSTLTSVPMILAQVNDAVRHGSGSQFATPSDAVVIGSQILTYFAGALIVPLYTIATTLFYYDVRIRREGFDLEFMAGRLEKSA
jgi:membrane-anchored glycerophosphoryl diester phosphodiesterase (GDPDase)